MDFICLDLKEEEPWVDLSYHLIKTKRELYSLVPLIKVNYLYVIGQPGVLMKLEAKMIQSFNIGINREILDQLSLWIYLHQIKT